MENELIKEAQENLDARERAERVNRLSRCLTYKKEIDKEIADLSDPSVPLSVELHHLRRIQN